jgi:hypothetical protein
MIKQRLKNRGVIFTVEALERAIQEEWDKITVEDINKIISTMLYVVRKCRYTLYYGSTAYSSYPRINE